eukprot:1157819-Pelagomonas_calceolata.AAC.2
MRSRFFKTPHECHWRTKLLSSDSHFQLQIKEELAWKVDWRPDHWDDCMATNNVLKSKNGKTCTTAQHHQQQSFAEQTLRKMCPNARLYIWEQRQHALNSGEAIGDMHEARTSPSPLHLLQQSPVVVHIGYFQPAQLWQQHGALLQEGSALAKGPTQLWMHDKSTSDICAKANVMAQTSPCNMNINRLFTDIAVKRTGIKNAHDNQHDDAISQRTMCSCACVTACPCPNCATYHSNEVAGARAGRDGSLQRLKQMWDRFGSWTLWPKGAPPMFMFCRGGGQ